MGKTRKRPRRVARDEFIKAAGVVKQVEDYKAADPTVYPAGHVRQYRDILAAIAGGKQPGVTVSDAVNALAAVRSVYVSATLGQPVLFEDVLAGKYNDLEVHTGSTPAESA